MATSSNTVLEDANRPTSSSSSSEASSRSKSQKPRRRHTSIERRTRFNLRTESITGCRSEDKLTPFYLRWSFGVNKTIPALNLSVPNRPLIFYASAHAGVLYDTKSTEMRLLHGHQNAVSCISADFSGRWIVTGDSGEDSVVIIWDSEKCIPVCTFFNHFGEHGVRLVGISPDAKYLVTVTNEIKQTISFWLWTYGKEEPDDSTSLDPAIGKFKRLEFNPENTSQVVLVSDNQMVFVTWVTKEENQCIQVHIPEIKSFKSRGVFTDVTYLPGTHQVLNSTSNGYVLAWSDVPYLQSFSPGSASNEKKCIKIIHLQKDSINVMCCVDNLVVTGNSRGHIRFYDKQLLLLYWCQSFKLDSITGISFNLAPRKYILKEPEDYIPDIDVMKKAMSLQSLDSEEEDRYEEFEAIYKNMVPSDATLDRRPFITRDFIVSTATGQVSRVDFLKNTCDFVLQKSDSVITAMDTHPEKKQICIGNKVGELLLYNFRNKLLLVENKIPATAPSDMEIDDGSYKEISFLKYDPAGFVLTCGMRDGSLWFLHPTLLTPLVETAYKHTSSAITKICFSPDSKFLAHIDEGMKVCLYRCENMDTCTWVFLGKQRSHYKPIRDLLFSEISTEGSQTQRLFSLGEDRMLVEYDLMNSYEDILQIINSERIEQSAIPLNMAWYPHSTKETFLFTTNSEFKYKILDMNSKMCEKTILGPTFGSPVSLIQFLPKPKDSQQTYMLFACSKYIGIQVLPVDGNPFKSVGVVGHPDKIIHMCASPDGTHLFTLGADDYCLHMWHINYSAVDVMARIGGEGLSPYYSIIEGGENGLLLREMKDLFYYSQILHQGENSNVEWKVSNKVPLCEIPDLMRAIGFYPSEYEVENMIHEVKNSKLAKTRKAVTEINFEDFVCLFINHRPAFGISTDEVKKAFDTLADNVTENSVMDRDTFISKLQEEGERFTQAQILRYFNILAPKEKWTASVSESDSNQEDNPFTWIPQGFTYTDFMDDILGIALNSPTEENCESPNVYEK
ncbi:cilia- and flagella-associated protein 251-like isoform X2 [Periplaneta americana]